MDYETLAGNFEKLLQTLKAEPKYQPVANDLKLPALEARLSDLHAKNDEAMRAAINLANVRNHRNEALYIKVGNVKETFLSVKYNVRTTFWF